MAGIPVSVPVPDIEAALAWPYTHVKLYSATARTGPFSSVGTSALVAGQTSYTITDSAGTAATWYRYTLYNSGTAAESAPTEAFPAQGAPVWTLLTLRRRVLSTLGLLGRPPGNYTIDGPSGTSTSAGTVMAVVCTDYADSLYLAQSTDTTSDEFRGYYLYVVSGGQAGQERRVDTLTTASGTFTTSRAFPGAPGNGVTFDLYGMMGARWWDERIDRARKHTWVPFRYPVAGIAAQTEYALPAFIEDRTQLTGWAVRSGTTLNRYTYAPGSDFDVIERDTGGVALLMASGFPVNEVRFLTGWRNPSPLAADTDSLLLSDTQADTLVVAAAAEAALWIVDSPGGLREDRKTWQERAARLEARRKALVRASPRWSNTGPARPDAMVLI